MDPRAVRGLGADLHGLGEQVTVVARQLDGLGLRETGDGFGLGCAVAPTLEVWADGVRALGTELTLLAERCEASARGVEAEDERARHRFLFSGVHGGGA